ncbi:MAG: DUF4215 domain-containing protein [Myxococcales bacterium]|nr:DUF4215 domain-containing protein [Myxococcales bacterium]
MNLIHLRIPLALLLVVAGCSGDDTATSATDSDGTTGDTSTGTTSNGTTSTSSTSSTSSTGGTETTGPICDVGTLNCACDAGACDGDLVCEAGVCVEAPMGVCGDGNVDAGEECDEGAANSNTGTCKADCTNQFCGDGYQGPREGCDDGNQVDDDACSNACVPAACGDGVVQQGEACDDANDVETDECLSTCAAASCGDSFIQEGVEECDDGNMDATDECTSECKPAACGDGFVQAGVEECDDGNDLETDECLTTCAAATCGDGFVQEGVEECDDGNDVDDDECSNACMKNLIPLGTIVLGGSSFANITTALDTIGEPYTVNNTQWLPPDSADILIMSNDGGNANGPDYNAHLNAGKHVLVFGGSSLAEYRTYWTGYFSIAAGNSWHQSNDCMMDWNKDGMHAITALLPDTYEFSQQSASYHMMHFNDAGQPANTTLLGRTCHQAPNNHVAIVRKYNNGGTLTYMLLDLGPYANGIMQGDFVVPFIQGYFDWLQQGAP